HAARRRSRLPIENFGLPGFALLRTRQHEHAASDSSKVTNALTLAKRERVSLRTGYGTIKDRSCRHPQNDSLVLQQWTAKSKIEIVAKGGNSFDIDTLLAGDVSQMLLQRCIVCDNLLQPVLALDAGAG